MSEKVTDWTLWDNREYFTRREASALLCGEPIWSMRNDAYEMENLIKEKLGQYRCDLPDHKEGHKNSSPFTGGFVNPSKVQGECRLSRKTLLAFAETIKIRPPFLFPEVRERTEVTASEKADSAILQGIMNKGGKHFVSELEAAVSAWNALFGESGIVKANKGYKAQITSWLEKNRPTLSTRAIGRIATLVNPKKSGGAPKTSIAVKKP